MIVEDHWSMMRWLAQYIEENKFEWGKRRSREIQKKNKELERLENMDKEMMILELKTKELERKTIVETKQERALRRKGYWKNWRNMNDQKGEKKETVKVSENRQNDQCRDLTELTEKTKEMKKRAEDWKREKTAKEELQGGGESPEEIAGLEEEGEFCLECV